MPLPFYGDEGTTPFELRESRKHEAQAAMSGGDGIGGLRDNEAGSDSGALFSADSVVRGKSKPDGLQSVDQNSSWSTKRVVHKHSKLGTV